MVWGGRSDVYQIFTTESFNDIVRSMNAPTTKISSATRLTASEFVAETLRREILHGELLPGQSLLQDHIATRFDVSQSSVREALRRLEALALVTSVRNRGTFVTTLSSDQVEEMYDIRLAVELIAIRNGLRSMSKEKLDEAASLLQGMEKDPETAFFLGEAHKRFHAIFFDHSSRKLGNDILQNIYGNLTRLWVDFIKKKPSAARRYEEESGHEHRELLKAAEMRDLAQAEAVLTRHINRARQLLVSHLRDRESDDVPTGKPASSPARLPKAASADQRTVRERAGNSRAGRTSVGRRLRPG
jgi:DNA-binding GntR family transcriptional regulator